ncbi:PPK2 family polyphosphate kinase [Fibrivirga algicola]|uniref:Polyphosphate kinase 2 family protein n=1 Tax=Fibrivirga algicola TaxID=2950420 RepID=A0ABX0QH05_9BACT|nr:PPK2 family polyphosphate kinase [Fibrivirga algicola]NID11446.1 polyphosphate kinase 2 family protein [Fibrivirga algicola]
MKSHHTDDFRYDGSSKFSAKKAETKIDDWYADDTDYELQLRKQAAEIDELQTRMYADNRYGIIAIFQAMDAAGKDGTIQHVFTGVNPMGLRVYSFKRPSEQELDHDWLWRTYLNLPERGTIGIFNRSYYEEVLVVKVHPEILTESQRIPADLTDDLDKVWKHRYTAITDMEKHLARNGFPTIKFFLNVSKKEQAERLIARIEDPEKNWKFEEQDVAEREFWDDYQDAFEVAINETATKNAPWYVIPADDKKNMRLIVGRILIDELKKLKIGDVKPDEERFAKLQKLIPKLKE